MTWRDDNWDASRIRDDYWRATREDRGTRAYERGLVEAGAEAMLDALKKTGQYIEDETALNREGLGHTKPGWRVWIPEERD